VDLKKIVKSIPGCGQFLPPDWSWTIKEMEDGIADRVKCCARPDITPIGCLSSEGENDYKFWQRVARHFLWSNPDCVDAWIVLGHSSYKLNQYEDATKAYRVAVKFKDDNATWVSLGLSSRHFIESSRAFSRAVELDPNDNIAWGYLGGEYEKTGDFINATNCYKKAVECCEDEESTSWSLFGLALNYLKSSNSEAAISSLELCLRADSYAFDCGYQDVAEVCKGQWQVAEKIHEQLSKINNELSDRFYEYYLKHVKN